MKEVLQWSYYSTRPHESIVESGKRAEVKFSNLT